MVRKAFVGLTESKPNIEEVVSSGVIGSSFAHKIGKTTWTYLIVLLIDIQGMFLGQELEQESLETSEHQWVC